MATTFFPCGQCGQQASADARFCPSCGTAMARPAPQPQAAAAPPNAGGVPPPFSATRLCGQCGTEFGTSARFCPHCGTPATTTPSSGRTVAGGASYAAAGPAPQQSVGPFLCARCGTQITAGTNFCPRCGNSSTTGATAAIDSNAYAGFGVRLVADLIDGVIGGVIFLLFVWLPIANIAISFAVMCLYGALTESSEHQASLGKRAMGLKVTDLEGKRISFGQALGRWFLKEFFSISVLGWLTFLAILFTKKKQGVHDLMASTLVWKTS